MAYYTTSLQQILAELERIDLLIQLQVSRARQLHTVDDTFQGLYISEEEVDTLLATPAGLPRWATEPLPLAQAEAQTALDQMALNLAWQKVESQQQGVELRLERLRQLCQLSTLEVDVLLIGLAPEIDLRYERLFGYLQDDVTKRRPSVDLVLNLLSPTFADKLAARTIFTPTAPLRQQMLVHLVDDPSNPHAPLLSNYLKVDERVVNYLFGADDIDRALLPYVHCTKPQTDMAAVLLPTAVKHRLHALSHTSHEQQQPCLFYFQGPPGVGKATTAAALAKELGLRFLFVDGAQLLTADDRPFDGLLRLILREALLQEALLYWSGFDALLCDERRTWCNLLFQNLAQRPACTVLAGDMLWEPVDLQTPIPFVRVEFPRPAYPARLDLWRRTLQGALPAAPGVNLGELATKFRFTGGQIRDAAATARNLAHWRDPEQAQVSMADLHLACRLHSNRKLGELARKITPRYTWDDIVLPADRMAQLHEIVNHIHYRATSGWRSRPGFVMERRLFYA